jgi:hypothetical protein
MMALRLAAVLLLVLGLPLLQGQPAALEPIKVGSAILTGSIRSRLENWHWFTPDSGDPSYAFLGNHARLNLTHTGKARDWTVELAAPILLGLPDNAIAPGAQGQLGMGASYFASNDQARNTAMIFPKQAFVRWKGLFGSAANSLRLGRFEFQDGSEVTAKNPTIGTVKRDRVHQRLIGPFVFTHAMRSFDGFHFIHNKPKLNLTLIGAVPTRGVFQVDGWGWMKTAFLYASATGQVQRGSANTGEWRLFAIYYHDWRQVLKQDNRPLALRQADQGQVTNVTYGGHYLHVTETKAGPVDLLAFWAGQSGKWGALDHLAGMINLEAGLQPKILPKLRPWLRGGYYHGSGDGNPNDTRHTTFFQILPTARPFARFPFFNMMNNEDIFGMLTLRPHAKLTLKSEVHGLSLASRNDLWYIGGGEFQPWSFGYQARAAGAAGGAKGLANLYDLSGDVTMNAHFAMTLYYGYAQGRSVTQAVYPRGKDGHLGYIELNYKF